MLVASQIFFRRKARTCDADSSKEADLSWRTVGLKHYQCDYNFAVHSGSDTKTTSTTAASPGASTTGTAAAKKQPKILRTEIKIDADNPLLSSRRLTEVNFFFLFPTEQEAEVACRFKAEKLIFAEAVAARMGVKRIRNLRFLTDKHPWWSSDIAKTFRAGWLEAFCPLRKKPFLYHVQLGLSTWMRQDGDEKLPGGVKIMTKFREKEKPPTLAAMVKGEKSSNLDFFPVSHLRRYNGMGRFQFGFFVMHDLEKSCFWC